MKKKLIFFGIGKIAEVIHYYATQECGFEVTAFCVDSAYRSQNEFLGKPVIDFEQVSEQYPPKQYDMFIAVGYHNLNAVRKEKCLQALQKGYELVSIISPEAKLPHNVVKGYNCFIMPPAIIHPCVTIGNNVFIWSGALVGHHSILEDHVWLTSNCNIGGNVRVGEQTFIALNATVTHSVTIAKNCFLGSNTLITKSLLDDQVVIMDSTKPIRLNSEQFLRISGFNSI